MNFDLTIVWNTVAGLAIPFLGTALGAACVFFLKKNLGERLSRALCGFAAGVMLASSVWSLLIPAIEQSEPYGKLSFLPALAGFFFGIFFLFGLDRLAPTLLARANAYPDRTKKLAMTVLAVTLHNIPEGMAVGAIYAGALAGTGDAAMSAAFALALGIAIQNFPEGAIISLPLHAEGLGKGRSFLYGLLSGVVEPLFGLLTLLAFGHFVPAMPYLLAFAAGAMIYVVVEELIPEMCVEKKSDGLFCFSLGFALMMALDVAL